MKVALLLAMMVGLSLVQGCALLSSDVSEEDMYANDPVARAAMALRNDRSPASLPQGPVSTTADGEFGRPDRLVMGMTTNSVQSLWGQPQEIENAGDPTAGNQRWIYSNGLKRDWGTSDYRVVYFEKNQVVGWENHR